jgi:hypothetical protein
VGPVSRSGNRFWCPLVGVGAGSRCWESVLGGPAEGFRPVRYPDGCMTHVFGPAQRVRRPRRHDGLCGHTSAKMQEWLPDEGLKPDNCKSMPNNSILQASPLERLTKRASQDPGKRFPRPRERLPKTTGNASQAPVKEHQN